MEDFRGEFQYLLDRKILKRDELAYLFGQIKSIVERETTQLQAKNKAQAKEIKQLKGTCMCMDCGETIKTVEQSKHNKKCKRKSSP